MKPAVADAGAGATTLPPAAEDRPAAAAGRRRWWRDRDVVLGGVAAVGFQVALTVVGVLVERAFSPFQTLSHMPAPPPPSLLQHMLRWDAVAYAGIPDGLYQSDPQAAAFYPLFPVLVRGVDLASFGLLGTLGAGLVVNTVGVWAAVVALVKAARRLVGSPRAGWLAVAVLLTAPPAFFLHVLYAEALFTGLGFAAYAFALHRRWAAMGLCLLPLTATRLTAVLFLGLCFLEFWRSRGWRWRGLLAPPVLWFPAALLGFGAYAFYLWRAVGDPFAMVAAYDAGPLWAYHELDLNILRTLGDEGADLARAATGDTPTTLLTVVDTVLPLLALAVLLAASVYLLVVLRGDGVPLAAFGVASFVMFTLNGNLTSVHRYVLPCVSLYLAAEVLAARRPAVRPVLQAVLYPAVLLQGALFALFVANHWAG
ncbi:hypothetical protein [Geodermatophilus sp. URMC 64]